MTFENVKLSVTPFLTDEMKTRLKEFKKDEDEDEDQEEKEEEEEETIPVSVKKNALERFWMTHPSLLSIAGGQSSKQHFTVSQIVRLYVVFEHKNSLIII